MAKTSKYTYTYVSLGIFVLVVLFGIFVYMKYGKWAADSSIKEGIKNKSATAKRNRNFSVSNATDISGNDIGTIPIVLVKKNGNAVINTSESTTKKFIRSKPSLKYNVKYKGKKNKTCQNLCEGLKSCKSFVVNKRDKTCSLKTVSSPTTPASSHIKTYIKNV